MGINVCLYNYAKGGEQVPTGFTLTPVWGITLYVSPHFMMMQAMLCLSAQTRMLIGETTEIQEGEPVGSGMPIMLPKSAVGFA